MGPCFKFGITSRLDSELVQEPCLQGWQQMIHSVLFCWSSCRAELDNRLLERQKNMILQQTESDMPWIYQDDSHTCSEK